MMCGCVHGSEIGDRYVSRVCLYITHHYCDTVWSIMHHHDGLTRGVGLLAWGPSVGRCIRPSEDIHAMSLRAAARAHRHIYYRRHSHEQPAKTVSGVGLYLRIFRPSSISRWMYFLGGIHAIACDRVVLLVTLIKVQFGSVMFAISGGQ